MTYIAGQFCRKMPRLYAAPGAADGPCSFCQVRNIDSTTGSQSFSFSHIHTHTNMAVQYQFTENKIVCKNSYVAGIRRKLSWLVCVYS
jgi:hypothetical protein